MTRFFYVFNILISFAVSGRGPFLYPLLGFFRLYILNSLTKPRTKRKQIKRSNKSSVVKTKLSPIPSKTIFTARPSIVGLLDSVKPSMVPVVVSIVAHL